MTAELANLRERNATTGRGIGSEPNGSKLGLLCAADLPELKRSLYFDSLAEYSNWLDVIHSLEQAGVADDCDAEINERLGALRETLARQFKSYDCHSFAYACLAAAGVAVPRLDMDGMDEDGCPGYGLPDGIRNMLESPEGEEIKGKYRVLTERCYQEGLRIDVPILIRDFSEWFRGSTNAALEDTLEQIILMSRSLSRRVLGVLQAERTSCWLLLTEGQPEKGFLDIHSMIMLGPSLNRDDLWIVHRTSAGGSILFRRLSWVLVDYMAGVSHRAQADTLTLSIPVGSVSGLLSPPLVGEGVEIRGLSV